MYNKLVRGNIPEIIKSNGENPVIRILDNDEYKTELEKKLLEEYNEVLESFGNDRIEELADMLEVMISIAELENKSLERGGFKKRLYLEKVE